MQGQFNDQIESYQVVDCRFGYEHQGGHIPGAINLSTVDRVKNYFLTKNCNTSPRGRELPPRSQSGRADCFGNTRKPILVFHCEFSAKRAPSMALALRQADRSLASDYPNCHYPELYILEGGYCGFFKTYEEICEPQAYVRMDDPAHVQMRSTELNGFRKQFSRHRSFTYGDAQAAAKQVTGSGSGSGKEGNGRPTSFFAMAMAGQNGNHTLREPTLGLPQHNLHNPKRRSALGQIVDGPNQSMCSEEESSFETDSPSNLAAVKKQSTTTAGGFLLPESGSTGDTSFDSNESFELGKPPVLLLRGNNVGGAAASGAATGGSASGSKERGPGDSPCAAAGNRRSGAGSMLLGVPGNGTGGAAGTLPPRRPFVRAGTTGGLFGR
jgi:rhodanese-related sulfurtransferase